ncbi:MAG: pilin [Methylococcaceae bacterium]
MKNHAYKLIIVLLFSMQTMAFAHQAIYISLSNPDGVALQTSDTQAIKDIISNSIYTGIINNFVTYNHDNNEVSEYAACVEANDNTSTETFNGLVNQLHAISPQTNLHYTLNYVKYCKRDNSLVCLNDLKSCLTSAFVTSGAVYSNYIARSQFFESLAEVSAGKAILEMMLNQGRITAPSIIDIGLQSSTKNCSSISVDDFDAAAGTAAITCIIQGNSFIVGKSISWIRSPDGVWACTTAVTDTQYTSGKCG